jgi:hypothetical protein
MGRHRCSSTTAAVHVPARRAAEEEEAAAEQSRWFQQGPTTNAVVGAERMPAAADSYIGPDAGVVVAVVVVE